MNAKKELLTHIGYSNSPVIAIEITYEYAYDCFNTYNWKKGEDWDAFISSLDFDYDAGYGTQHIFGTIWHEDGTWSSRQEYDGSEWWLCNKCPEIPSYLK